MKIVWEIEFTDVEAVNTETGETEVQEQAIITKIGKLDTSSTSDIIALYLNKEE